VNAHLAQRARERLGVDLTEAGAAGIVSAIQTGRLEAIPATGEGRAWYETTIQGVRAWVLYDFRTRSLVTLLGEPPANTLPGRVTLFALADEYGLHHAEAKRIAGRLSEPLRHAHKATTVLGHQISRLRPLFAEAAKKEEESMQMLPALPARMTVKQVADALGCDDETVRRHVKDMWPNIFKNGTTTSLDECMVLHVKNKLAESGRNDLRNVAEVKDIHTELEMKQKAAEVLGWLASEADRLRAELALSSEALALAAPKVEAFDRLLDASGTVCLTDAAKALGQSPKKFFDDCHALGVLFRRAGQDWVPYQSYLDRGWFEVKTRTYGEGPHDHVTEQTRVTPKGLDGMAKLFPISGQVSA
jgi:phage antirepressor YoqD-like protein